MIASKEQFLKKKALKYGFFRKKSYKFNTSSPDGGINDTYSR
jgi:hypothetical protein